MKTSEIEDGVLFKFKDQICYKTQFVDATLLVTISPVRGVALLNHYIDVEPIVNVKLSYTTEAVL